MLVELCFAVESCSTTLLLYIKDGVESPIESHKQPKIHLDATKFARARQLRIDIFNNYYSACDCQ
jgi:hypothetical protein